MRAHAWPARRPPSSFPGGATNAPPRRLCERLHPATLRKAVRYTCTYSVNARHVTPGYIRIIYSCKRRMMAPLRPRLPPFTPEGGNWTADIIAATGVYNTSTAADLFLSAGSTPFPRHEHIRILREWAQRGIQNRFRGGVLAGKKKSFQKQIIFAECAVSRRIFTYPEGKRRLPDVH